MIDKIVSDYSKVLNVLSIEHKILEHPYLVNPEFVIILKKGDDQWRYQKFYLYV